MIECAFPPGLLLLGTALLLPLLSPRWRTGVLLGTPIVVLALIWTTSAASDYPQLLNYTLHWYEPTALGRLFATVFLLLLFITHLFALGHASVVELSAATLYAGSAVIVVLSGDFLSLLLFWEVMMLGSTVIIFAANTPAARQAGMRYLILHLLSGVLLLIGILGLIAQTGDISLRALQTDTIYSWLILISFLINVGAPPLSAWVADAYPQASASGMVYLSAFTTKTAVFALLVVFPGKSILIPVGLYMIFYGIIYALNENDMRRILAYSIVNQVGFMVTGIGIGSTLALNGAAMHAFAHILYKGLLLMSAGSVLYATGRSNCTDLGGLYRTMRLTTVCGIIGALAISSFPLTSGFVTKPMISEAALVAHITWVSLALTVAAAGVFLHAGIKFPWFVFFSHDAGLKPKALTLNMRWAMIITAALCLLPGIFPAVLYQIQPWQVIYTPYYAEHVITQIQLLLFAGVAFFVMLPLLKRTTTITLDFDYVYRKLLPLGVQCGCNAWQQSKRVASNTTQALTPIIEQWLTMKTQRIVSAITNGHSGTMVMVLIALLILILFAYY